MRRLLKWPVIIAFLLLTIISIIAWLSNFIYSYPEWSILKCDFILKICLLAQKIPLLGRWHKFDITRVDMSSITTFLLILTFAVPLFRLIIIYINKFIN